MKIITTDEEIARFVAINIVSTIFRLNPQNRMTGEHLIGLKNAIKGDILNNFQKTNENFENVVNDSLKKS